ncbi:MAG: hypothetical protein ACHQ6U_00700 [Thermodesulfobacteriota bacterium]
MKPSFMRPNHDEIEVGVTEELSLRVSVGALVSVLFESPEDERTMLALERAATLIDIEGRSEVTVMAKPFGGAVRLTNPQALKWLIGNFNYDSKRSREERDFRILIHKASWEKVKEICRDYSKETVKEILDSSPDRELAEEFEDTLNVKISQDHYHLRPWGVVVEDFPSETKNVRAKGIPTVRIYYLFEAWMMSPDIITMMLSNNRLYSDKDLQKMAWKDAQRGGKGRANAILVLGLDNLKSVYRAIPTYKRDESILVDGHQLDVNVQAILEDAENSRYKYYIR